MHIDLHTHSSVSDGTDLPAELVRHAAAAGLDVVALTDHDTVDGWPSATGAAAEAGVVVVPGVEMSTRLRGAGVHVLAYLPDPGFAPLADELARVRGSRATRLSEMTALLTEAGLPLTVDDVLAVAGRASTLGRPHVADAMVARGYVADRSEAFATWLWEGGPAYVPKYAPPTDRAIRLIRDAGGVAVLAHPWGRGSRGVLDADTIRWLAGLGLAGVEVDHEDHDRSERVALHEVAAALDLVVTGSSDYHGTGKTGHALGVNTTGRAEYERLLDRARRAAAAAGRQPPRLGVA
ncbi:MAG: PHP domain-containing protein [Jiangellaceae bacterium]